MKIGKAQPLNAALIASLPLILVFSLFLSLGAFLHTSDSVLAQGVDYIVITDTPGGNPVGDVLYSLGETDTYYCSGYNASLGYVGLIACTFGSENPNILGVSPTNNTNFTVVSAVNPGTTHVYAFAYHDPDVFYDATGKLTVLNPPADYIIIMNTPDGSTGLQEWVGDTTYHLGEMDWFYAVAFNNTYGKVGMVNVNWTSTNSTVCNITDYGEMAQFIAQNEGMCKVTAEYLQTFYNTTGKLKVVGRLDYIVITDAPDGKPIVDTNYTLGETDEFYCSGYNYTQGFLGLELCHWTSENLTVGDISPRMGENVTFFAKSLGHTYVTAYQYDPGQNISWNITGRLEVVPDNVDYIAIVDAYEGGQWVGDRSYRIGDDDIFFAEAYNHTLGPIGLIPVNWTSTNTTVCKVSDYGSSTSFTALRDGSCIVLADYKGRFVNTTGVLTVTAGGMITVDDDGAADFRTIQEAIDAATPGDSIFVYSGIYPEHVIVNKSVNLTGESPEDVIVTGGGWGRVFYISADMVSLSQFTIRDAEFGIMSDGTANLVVSHNIVTNYTYGIYQNKTRDSWITYNDISIGKYGLITYYSYNDAIRYNYISYNTVYGAKDFNSNLKNCFNWNRFYKNKIAYWYDPDQDLYPLEFDGNTIEENEIGVRVNGSSSINLTNNTFLKNDIGIQILDSSPLVMTNTFAGNDISILCENSSSSIIANTIIGSRFGIYCQASGLLVKNNDISSRDEGIYIMYATSGSILGNNLHGGRIRTENSSMDEVSLVNTELESISSTFGKIQIDMESVIWMRWRLVVQVLDERGEPIKHAKVRVYNSYGDEVGGMLTRADGCTEELLVTQSLERSEGVESFNPHLVTAEKDGLKGSVQEFIRQDKQLSIVIKQPSAGEVFWVQVDFLIVLGVGIALGSSVLAIVGSEGCKMAFVSLILPLYMKLKKSKLLDNYDRGRVYQYIELNPGEHYNQIRRDLGLPNGSLVHHLNILEKAGKIKSRKDGRFRRFYTEGTRIPLTDGGELTEIQRRITDLAKDMPGITQKELASLLGVHQSSINYQMGKLEEKGLVRMEKKGRKVHYYYVGND